MLKESLGKLFVLKYYMLYFNINPSNYVTLVLNYSGMVKTDFNIKLLH